jgi:hypothetical protein
MSKAKEIAENAYTKAEQDRQVVKWRTNVATLEQSARKARATLKQREQERASLDLNDPLAAERMGKLGIEIEGHRAILAGIEKAIGEAEENADKAFKSARMAGLTGIRNEEIRVKDRAVKALAVVLEAAAELNLLHGSAGHLGGYSSETLTPELVNAARMEVERWKGQKAEYPHKFAGVLEAE